jgi:hypothetical protein
MNSKTKITQRFGLFRDDLAKNASERTFIVHIAFAIIPITAIGEVVLFQAQFVILGTLPE